MRLLTGPPRSGKTAFCLGRIRQLLRSPHMGWRLILPTATLAEHLRNQLAREGFAFPPSRVTTLSKFIEGVSPPTQTCVSEAILELLIDEVLKDPPAAYARVAGFKGFRRALAGAVSEFASAGGTLEHLSPRSAAFAAILAGVRSAMSVRGLVFRSSQILQAATALQPIDGPVFVVGFYSFTTPELVFLEALAAKSDLTVTISEWPGVAPSLNALRRFARETTEFEARPHATDRTLVTAPSTQGEVDEIACRILDEHRAGRPWRDIAVITRSEQPYVPALESAFRRFRIPARFHFANTLEAHPAVRYLAAIIDASFKSWDLTETLRALRLPGSPLEHADQFDFHVRELLPGSGLDVLKSAAPDGIEYFDRLHQLDEWSSQHLAPAEWAAKFAGLTSLCHTPQPTDRIAQDRAALERSYAAALAAWKIACTETAEAFDTQTVSGLDFWRALETILSATSLRVPDHRRDVVNVIDAFEARQWQVPVVFVCGLVEKQFPKYQGEDPILSDELRRELQRAGLPLRTSVERGADEQFLFDVSAGCAGEKLILSYPVLNARADENLPSFLLERAKPYATAQSRALRPLAERSRAEEPDSRIAIEELQVALKKRHATISATAIESYLQCPFSFFAQQTLKLSEPPSEPWDRLNPLVQGNIIHGVLERIARENVRDTRKVREVLDSVFAEQCAKAKVPPGYRTEAIRLELLQNIECFVADLRLTCSVQTLTEQSVRITIDEQTAVTGRIDRIEIDDQGRATVIDYKYKSKASLQRTRLGHDKGTHVQGGLYLLGLPQLGPYTPAGMVYCGMKREVTFGGWVLKPLYMDLRQSCSEDELSGVMQRARELTAQAVYDLRGGRIAPKPADEARCEWCSFQNACRVEKQVEEMAADAVSS